jgi:predicted acylesterase/phospholipase RssA
MPFPIEIITTDASLLPAINRALEPLTRIQSEFRYTMPSYWLHQRAYLFKKNAYTSREIEAWLDSYKDAAGGHRPYLLLIISGPLNGNHFGGRVPEKNYAFFTVDNHHQFVNDLIRYCRYYIVRYTLSFVAPEILSHPSVPQGCMFDKKEFKPDILRSLNNGRICDGCHASMMPHLNPDIQPALASLLQIVSNQHPYSLVLKGGGVKGLALVGALLELEKYYSFNTFAGTSAGAIAAILLGAGYRPEELKDILKELDFANFKDSRTPWGYILSIFRKSGLHSGDHFVQWMENMLAQKLTENVGVIEMQHLPERAIVYASRKDKVLRFDKNGEHKEVQAAFAARASMSIPGFFAPVKVDGYNVYDGGMGNNFPLRLFLQDNQHDLFIGLYLRSPIKRKTTIADDLFNIATDADERSIVDEHRDKIVVIDPVPIRTTQFELFDDDKAYLLQAGKVGALDYLVRYNPGSGVTAENVQQARTELARIRSKLPRIQD